MMVATYPDPAPASDAGRVLAVIRTKPGQHAYELAARTRLTVQQVFHACKYLQNRGKIHRYRELWHRPGALSPKWYSFWLVGPAAQPQRVDASVCRAAMGYGRQCGTRLVETTDHAGRVRFACPACERRSRGQCRTCHNTTTRRTTDGPPPWYCATCLRERRRRRDRQRSRTPEARAARNARDRRRRNRRKLARAKYAARKQRAAATPPSLSPA